MKNSLYGVFNSFCVGGVYRYADEKNEFRQRVVHPMRWNRGLKQLYRANVSAGLGGLMHGRLTDPRTCASVYCVTRELHAAFATRRLRERAHLRGDCTLPAADCCCWLHSSRRTEGYFAHRYARNPAARKFATCNTASCIHQIELTLCFAIHICIEHTIGRVLIAKTF